MRGSASFQAVSAGLLSAFVGIASSFTVIVQGLMGVGATPAEAASGLMALSIAMGLCGVFLSLRTRMPISVAWSTPGRSPPGQLGIGGGRFSGCGRRVSARWVLIVLAGFWRPLGRWVAAIPAPLANAMLAGVVLGLCLAPVRAVAAEPTLGLAVVAVWAVLAKFKRLYAVPAAVLAA